VLAHAGRALARTGHVLARAGRALACAALAGALLACPRAEEAPRPPPVLLVSIDTLRADRLGVYGADADTSPAMDRLAAEGVRFSNAIATSSWTLPSHVSLMTGMPVPVHRVSAPQHRIDPARELLAERFAAAGYDTAAFVSAPFLHRAYGFDRGFDVYENFQGRREAQIPPKKGAHEASHSDQTAPSVVDAALAWLAERPVGDRPWFLFVHLWDAHYDFIPPRRYVEMFDPDYDGDLDPTDFEENPAIRPGMDPRDLRHLRALYDAEIRRIDDQVARLLEALDARGEADATLVALVGDHGEEFFEHGNKGHMKALFEESIRVPWLMRQPGVLAPGTVVDGVVALDDVGPTLLGLAGLDPLGEATGHDLSAALRAGGAGIGAEKLSVLPDGRAVLRGPGWKVLHAPRSGYAVYYDLDADPGEQSPRAVRQVAPEKLEELEDALAAAEAASDALPWEGEDDAVELDPATRDRLRALGYVE
jgi:arylsulfatase A-like enzyme